MSTNKLLLAERVMKRETNLCLAEWLIEEYSDFEIKQEPCGWRFCADTSLKYYLNYIYSCESLFTEMNLSPFKTKLDPISLILELNGYKETEGLRYNPY